MASNFTGRKKLLSSIFSPEELPYAACTRKFPYFKAHTHFKAYLNPSYYGSGIQTKNIAIYSQDKESAIADID